MHATPPPLVLRFRNKRRVSGPETFEVDKQNGLSDDSDALSASPSGFVQFCVEASRRLLVSRFLGNRFFARSMPVLPMSFAGNGLPPELTVKRLRYAKSLCSFTAERTFVLVNA